MVSANHLLMVFLGVEMASVPSYVLAGLLRHGRTQQRGGAEVRRLRRGRGRRDALRHQPAVRRARLGPLAHDGRRLAELRPRQAGGGERRMVLVLAALMIMVGLAFKLSAVPFHFWAPDVFEGATAEVAAFLSVASKAAALALLVRLAVGFGQVDPAVAEVRPIPVAAESASTAGSAIRPAALVAAPAATTASDAPAPVRHYHGGPGRALGRCDLHVRQSRGLRADEHQAAAGLFDHRARWLHDDGHCRDVGADGT